MYHNSKRGATSLDHVIADTLCLYIMQYIVCYVLIRYRFGLLPVL